jgi:hypothetical protein
LGQAPKLRGAQIILAKPDCVHVQSISVKRCANRTEFGHHHQGAFGNPDLDRRDRMVGGVGR